MTRRHTTRMMASALAVGLLALSSGAARADAAAAHSTPITITVSPNPTAYGKRTTFTARARPGAHGCSLSIGYQLKAGGLWQIDLAASKVADARGLMSWVWRPERPTPGQPLRSIATAWVSCRGGMDGRVRFVVTAKGSPPPTAQYRLFIYWRSQMYRNSYACFGHVGSVPADTDEANQIVQDCTTGFMATPPPGTLVEDPRVQETYDTYTATAADEAKMAQDAIGTGYVDATERQNALDDYQRYNVDMDTLEVLCG